MSIRTLYFVACTQCNNSHGPYAETAKEAMSEAQELGWEVAVPVPNGSLWDFCPKCVKRNKAKSES